MRCLLAAVLLTLAAAPAPASAMQIDPPPAVVTAPATDPPIAWRDSRAVGRPYAGRLVDGVQLPAEGRDFWTYDWGLRVSPNRPWRRWGTDRLVQTLLDVLAGYRAARPEAPRVGIADLSRPHGGRFGKNFGGLGHSSHQNGLDGRFVAAGAVQIYTGWSLHLRGPRKRVVKLAHHDDHMHVRVR